MTVWIKLMVAAVDGPKLDSISDAALRWILRAWSYAGQYETDGELPPSWIKRVPPRIRAELDAANLWHQNGTPGGREIHDWLEIQPSKKQLAEQRAATVRRVRKHRE